MSSSTIQSIRIDAYDIIHTLKFAWCGYLAAREIRRHGPIPTSVDPAGFVAQIGQSLVQASVAATFRAISSERNDRRSLPRTAEGLRAHTQELNWPLGEEDLSLFRRTLGRSPTGAESAVALVNDHVRDLVTSERYARLQSYRDQFVSHMDSSVDHSPFWRDLADALDSASDAGTAIAVLVLPSAATERVDLRHNGRRGERFGADEMTDLVGRMLRGLAR